MRSDYSHTEGASLSRPYRISSHFSCLADIFLELPASILLTLYDKPLNIYQRLYFLHSLRKIDFVNNIAATIKASKVHFRSFDPAESPRSSIVQTIGEMTSSAGVVVPLLSTRIEDFEKHNIRAAFLAGLAHGLGREALLIRHETSSSMAVPIDFRDVVIGVKTESESTARVREFCQPNPLNLL